MKRINIDSDKKLKIYIILLAIICELYFLFLFKELKNTMNSDIMNIWGSIVYISIAIATINILRKFQCSIWLDDIKIQIGNIFPQSILYCDIKKIELNEKIIIYSKNNNKVLKIEIINLEDNIKKYKELLEIVSVKSNLDLDIDKLINNITEIKKDSYIRIFSGLLKYINVYFIFSLINIVYKFITHLNGKIDIVSVILFCTITIFNISLIYLVSSRYKHTVKLMLVYIVLQFFILNIIIEKPNWLLAIVENINFDLNSNIVWLILFFINIFFIVFFQRYFKVYKFKQTIFINDKVLKLGGYKKEKLSLNSSQKSIIKIGIGLIIAVTIFSIYLIVNSEIKTDKNYYDSINEIISKKYENIETVVISDNNYSFIITDEKESLVIRNNEGKYIFDNNWHDEAKNINLNLKVIDMEKVDFHAIKSIYIDGNHCMILIEQYLIKEISKNVLIFDDYNQWEIVEAFGHKYFYNVIDKNQIDEDYTVKMEIDNNIYNIIEFRELN